MLGLHLPGIQGLSILHHSRGLDPLVTDGGNVSSSCAPVVPVFYATVPSFITVWDLLSPGAAEHTLLVPRHLHPAIQDKALTLPAFFPHPWAQACFLHPCCPQW